MKTIRIDSLIKNRRWPIIAVVYLPASLGYKNHPGMSDYFQDVLAQVHILLECGADGVLLENENDRPYTLTANKEVLATMVAAACRVRWAYPDLYLGVEFLLNDPATSLAVAKAAQADFIRTDYWVDRMSRPEYGGEMAIDPEGINHYREYLGAQNIDIYADIQVKYAQMIHPRALIESANEAIAKKAQVAVVSGDRTGEPIGEKALKELALVNPAGPIFLGSGLSLDNFEKLLPWCEGAIVGTALMQNGRIDFNKAHLFFEALRNYRTKHETGLLRRHWD